MRPREHAGPFPPTTVPENLPPHQPLEASLSTYYLQRLDLVSESDLAVLLVAVSNGWLVGRTLRSSSSPNARFGFRIEPFDSFLLTFSNDCLASQTFRSFLGGRRWIRPSDRALRLFPRPPPASGAASVSRTTTPCADSRAQSRGWREILTLSAGLFALSPGTGEMSTGHPQPAKSVGPARDPDQSPTGRPKRSTPQSRRHKRDTRPAEITPGVTRAASTGRMAW